MSKISVIVPVYNVGKYIEKTVFSVLNQTYKDFELIIIDDGSKDGSGEICDRLACNDSRVKVIHQQNAGVSVARNVGMAEAIGEWITFLDGDDYLDENYLQEMITCAESGNYQIVMCAYCYVDSKGIDEYSFFSGDKLFDEYDREFLIKTALGEELPQNRKATTGGPWMKLFKRSFLLDNGFLFVPGLKKTQDVIFIIDCFSKVDNLCYIDKHLYFYVNRAASTVNSYHYDQNQTSLQVMGYLKKFFSKNTWIKDSDVLYNSRVLVLILEVFKLKYVRKECDMAFFEKLKEIKMLCSDELCASALEKRKYYKLSKKLRVFEYLISKRWYFLSYLLCKVRYSR